MTVTADESWTYRKYDRPESRRQSKQRFEEGEGRKASLESQNRSQITKATLVRFFVTRHNVTTLRYNVKDSVKSRRTCG